MRRRTVWAMGAVAALLTCGDALAASPQAPRLAELMAGANGDARVQFVEIETGLSPGCWGPVGPYGPCDPSAIERGSRAHLTFYDAAGRETGRFPFPGNPAAGRPRVLVATRAFARLPGAPAPDFVMPPFVNAVSGRVCFTLGPVPPRGPAVNDCVSYGKFDVDGETFDRPAPALEIVDTNSLHRGSDGDFTISHRPTPTNAAGATFTLAVAQVVAQGRTLFEHETFQGNGRTCSSCHVAQDSFGLRPNTVTERFASLAQTYDPLFIAETVNFDFNLNTLTLERRPQPADLTGTIRGTTGVAKVLGRVGPTTYLVYGGMSPQLSGRVTDGVSSAPVADVTPGDLDQLEDPPKMQLPLPFSSVPFRTLIRENIDGFDATPVLRKSPHLLNLSLTAPFGFSGSFDDLRSFSRQAVVQHFPRSLARVDGVDFRLPTERELAALEAFQLSLEFPGGSDPDRFNLDRFATTSQQRLGRRVFFGPVAKCSRCHGGPLLNETDGTVGQPPGRASFNTGVSSQPQNAQDGLPQEPGADGSVNGREFNVPSLFNVKNTLPMFHDGSASLGDAVFFYNDAPFNESPAGAAVGGISFDDLSLEEINSLLAFLRSLVVRPYTLSGPVDFGTQVVGQGVTARDVVIANTSADPITFQSPRCLITGPDSPQFGVVCPLTTPLLPGESRTIRVLFFAQSAGPKHATLEINAPDPSGVDLSGIAVPGASEDRIGSR